MTRLPIVVAAIVLAVSPLAAAQQPLRLLVWINGDKGYNGLQKVGDAFEKIERRAGRRPAPGSRA